MKRWLMLLTMGLCLQTQAATLAEKTKELHTLQKRMQLLNKNLNNAKDKRATLNTELQHIDVDINNHSVRLRKTHDQWQREHDQVIHLQAASESSKQQLEEQISVLKSQIRASYQLGQQETLQLLLNQQDPSEISRQLTYYNYVSKARNQMIGNIEQKLGQLLQLHQSINQHTFTLQSLIQQSTQHIHALQDSKQYQQKVITKLNSEIQSTQQQLTEMQRNKQALENLVRTLKLSAARTYKQAGKPFAQMLHNLVLPVQGNLTTRFGEVLGDARARSNGIFIRAREDEPVRAIYPGRVIFANWMRGFGLLLIIDHGQGYLSLYAHNNSLYQKVGDVIHTGDLIAKVGHSGGQTQDGLYVEIRKNGRPIDPLNWLARSTSNSRTV